ncbi:hypothetical protein MMC25_004145 [Agyrium rufum]|nr:hypothetical protein [Agyrium rufum]
MATQTATYAAAATEKPTESPTSSPAVRHRRSVLLPRAIFWGVLITAVFLPSLYQPFLSSLWNHLYHSPIYRFSGFETFETILCYIIIEPLYTVQFTRNPNLRIDVRHSSTIAATTKNAKFDTSNPKWPKMKRPSKRLVEIATYIAPLLTLDLILIKKFADVPVQAIRQSGGYPPLDDGQIGGFFLSPTLHNFSLKSPLQLTRALPTLAPTSRRIVLELAVAFFIYDALFFFIHIAFHRIPALRQIHWPHHRHAEMNPQVTNKLSVTERVSLILLANFALNIIRSHVFTRTMFVPFFVYLLVEVHCGLDLDWGYDKILPGGWGAGSVKHAYHHRVGEGFYQPFFSWWDNGVDFLERREIEREKQRGTRDAAQVESLEQWK